MANGSEGFGRGTVIAAMIGVGLIVGLAFGTLGSLGLLPSGVIPVFIGLVCGVTAPLLIWRMRAAR